MGTAPHEGPNVASSNCISVCLPRRLVDNVPSAVFALEIIATFFWIGATKDKIQGRSGMGMVWNAIDTVVNNVG